MRDQNGSKTNHNGAERTNGQAASKGRSDIKRGKIWHRVLLSSFFAVIVIGLVLFAGCSKSPKLQPTSASSSTAVSTIATNSTNVSRSTTTSEQAVVTSESAISESGQSTDQGLISSAPELADSDLETAALEPAVVAAEPEPSEPAPSNAVDTLNLTSAQLTDWIWRSMVYNDEAPTVETFNDGVHNSLQFEMNNEGLVEAAYYLPSPSGHDLTLQRIYTVDSQGQLILRDLGGGRRVVATDWDHFQKY